MSVRSQIAARLATALGTLPFNSDPNVAFSPPPGNYATLSFVEGAEVQRSIGGAQSLLVTPLLAYVDLWTQLDQGDGDAVDLARVVKNSLRRQVLDGARWHRFEEGPEGRENGRYRKQVVAVFWQFDRG